LSADSRIAVEAVHRRLDLSYRVRRFPVNVEGEAVLIPYRLHFCSGEVREALGGTPGLMARCLESRSTDGFRRQRAIRAVLAEVEPWSVPFVAAPIGEYVIEILDDIEAAMSPGLVEALAEFALANPAYWRLTRQRVASYWDEYYRRFERSDYVGYRLVGRIDAALKAAKQGGSVPGT
jgi:hypothetical protein